MATKTCPKCGRLVPAIASRCDGCGFGTETKITGSDVAEYLMAKYGPVKLFFASIGALVILAYAGWILAMVTGLYGPPDSPAVIAPASAAPATAPAAAASPSDEWLPLASHIWTGVKVYNGMGADKGYGFEVLGGNEHYTTRWGETIRGMKVLYPDGSIEWKDRNALIEKPYLFVRADDPALAAMQWQIFDE